MTKSLSELVTSVADNTLERDMEAEDWEKGAAINGLVETGREEYVQGAKELVDRSIETQTSAGQLTYGSLDYKPWVTRTEHDQFKGIADPAAIGRGVLEFYDRTGEDYYLDAARRQYEFLQSATRTEEGGISHLRDYTELWVDSLYMFCPFMAMYGAAADEPAAYDDATLQIKLQSKYLQDPHTGLFRHEWRENPNMYPESTFWSRGNGWGGAAIVDTLDVLPDDHEDREVLVESLQRLCEGVVDLQDRSGFWHHILDDRESPLETSGTLMFSYIFKRGVEEGLLDEDPYLDAARDGLEVCRDLVTEDGDVTRVSVPPGGPDMPLGVTTYGQGWFLLAAEQFAEA